MTNRDIDLISNSLANEFCNKEKKLLFNILSFKNENKSIQFESEHQELLWLQEQYRILWEFLKEENLEDLAETYLETENQNAIKEILKFTKKSIKKNTKRKVIKK